MQIFVTGGSGFVGGHLIRALVAAGHGVSAHSRSPKSAAAVAAKGARPVSGELGAHGVPPGSGLCHPCRGLCGGHRGGPLCGTGADRHRRVRALSLDPAMTVRTDRAKAELGYAPVITVEEGIAAMRR